MGRKILKMEPRQVMLVHDIFERWGVDAIGPLLRTARGKIYILTAVGYLSKWSEAKVVKNVDGKSVADFIFEHICCRFGVPLKILSDNGPGFRSEVLNHLCERLSIHHKYVTPYHPQCNGLNEKFNGELKLMMTKMIQGKEKSWDLELNRVLSAYRTAVKPSMQFSPY